MSQTLEPEKLYANIDKFFNASLIGDISPGDQKKFKLYCQNELKINFNSNSHRNEPVIHTLIKRFYRNFEESVEEKSVSSKPIRFPIDIHIQRMVHMTSTRYGKNVYMIGEQHRDLQQFCEEKTEQDINAYIIDLLERSPVFIDFFLEVDIVNFKDFKRIPDYALSQRNRDFNAENPMTLMAEKELLRQCELPQQYGQAGCRTFRYHQSDLRRVHSRSRHPDRRMKTKMWYTKYLLQENDFITTMVKMRSIDYVTMTLKNDRLAADMTNVVLRTIYVLYNIQKQDVNNFSYFLKAHAKHKRAKPQTLQKKFTDKLPPNVYKTCVKFTEKMAHNLISDMNLHIIRRLVQLPDKKRSSVRSVTDASNNTKYSVQELWETFTTRCLFVASWYMDCYTVLRFMQKFKTSPSPVKQPSTCHNIVYFSGTNHTKRICQLLKELDFQIEYNIELNQNAQNCGPDCTDTTTDGCDIWFTNTEHLKNHVQSIYKKVKTKRHREGSRDNNQGREKKLKREAIDLTLSEDPLSSEPEDEVVDLTGND